MSTQEFKLCAIVITYYPDIEDVKINIMKYLPWIDHLLIWENTPVEDKDNYKLNFSDEYADKITFLGEGINKFISYPLNRAVKWAQLNGFTHILTMDQDSTWNNFKEYRDQIIKKINHSKIFAPNINNQIEENGDIKREYSITSGTIYSIELFEKIGLFNEQYKIDSVDIEFGIRAYTKGYHTLFLTNCYLNQRFGNTVKHGRLKVSNYSHIRRYFIMRNDIWLYKTYKEVLPKSKCKYIKKELFIETYKIIRFEKNKIKKLKYLYKGLFEGILTNGRDY